MTAIQKQTVKVYIINFEGCMTRAGFFARLARTLGLSASLILDAAPWKAICKRVATIAASGYSVRVQLHGLDGVFPILPGQCERLLRVLRAAEGVSTDFRSEAIIGDAKWKI